MNSRKRIACRSSRTDRRDEAFVARYSRSASSLRHGVIAVAAGLLLTALAACGAEEGAPESAASAGDDFTFAVVTPDRVYSLDDFVAAGWKKSKEYDASVLPGATSAWYGFAEQKDIELWFYETHEQALSQGQESAIGALNQQKRIGGGERGAGTRALTTYEAYLVAGNTVMLCEIELAVCKNLVDRVQ